jgi:ABC-type cobalamin/Fe3+-siderophores transport system ATPase subunit
MTGSNWRKWDLHFHSQTSYDYKNGSVTDQDIIDNLVANNVAVVAITDHHTIDITRIKNLQKIGSGRITVLPGIEFLSDARGDEPIHFIGIFSEKCNIDFVWKQIESRTELKRIQGEGKKHNEVYCHLFDTIKIIKELNGIVTIHAGSKANSIDNITHSLQHGLAQKEDIARAIDIFELGKEDDLEGYKTKVIPYIVKAIGKRIPMIICSDNHDIKNYSVKQNLWIKADPTFEGLKQILFEPKYRVFIGADAPIDPLIRINKVNLDFPIDSKFENEIFCLAGKNEIEFSPSFTCLIGGRGTGKSTILNLIHEKLKVGENKFFQTKKIKDASGKMIPIETCVTIDNDADEKYIEFLSQNEVEEFAQDYQKLTAAVYTRILKRDDEGLIAKNEGILNDKLKEFQLHIIQKKRLESLKIELEQRTKELGTNKKLVESFTSQDYKTINDGLKSITSKLNTLNNSYEQYTSLLQQLNELTTKFKQTSASNLFSQEVDRIVKGIEQLVSDSKNVDFTLANDERATLEKELIAKRNELRKYLTDKGLTEESQKDISNANIVINSLEAEIERKKQEIIDVQKRIDSFKKVEVITASANYKNELEKQIKSISSILEQLENETVKPISLQFEFDNYSATERVFGEFKKLFEGHLARSNHKGDAILWEILFSISPDKLTDKDTLLATIQQYPSASTAKQFLTELFSQESNFEVYKLLCEMTFLNYAAFKRVKVQYDKRPIESSSFGQRCTAVLVILLLLGNNPVIIDEPEAHLDSLLISNYLVEVIKDRKRSRQIIFATHNANFVVNGDAELIHILSIDEQTQKTVITSTTIENGATRETLISLEGGREAFIKRESKYQFHQA